ncbi:hypothetical protein ADK82_30445 [Streptomyces sp. NRRL S-4]|nr:hypothetical protein ADK82_30445 [Streptomyces sp. NRRL S-4]
MQSQKELSRTQQEALEDAGKKLDQAFTESRADLLAAGMRFDGEEASSRCLRCDCRAYTFDTALRCECGHRMGVHDVW